MNPTQKQFSLDRAASKKQFPISINSGIDTAHSTTARSVFRWLMLSGAFLFLICAGGCVVGDHGQYSTLAPGIRLAPNTRAVIGGAVERSTAKSPEGKVTPDTIDPDEELRVALEKELEKSGLKGKPDAVGVIVLFPTVADYEKGNAFLRGMAAGSGKTLLLARCRMMRDGGEIGTLNVRRTVEMDYYGSSVGQWKAIFQTVAGDMVKELKMKIKDGQ